MIRLIDVQKTYDNGTRALKGISMKIEDGEFVFLVGPSGSGKSTILKIITGEVTCSGGRIMVNGYNMNNIRPRQIPYMRRTLGVIFQDFRLIEKKTVEENLTFVMRVVGASPREIRKRVPYVLQLVGLDHKGDRLPTELSGGEQQRIALARAILKNAPILILDEATANVDPENEAELQKAIEALTQGKTIIMIAHRLKTVKNADQIIVINQGKISQQGTHDELIKQAGIYADFVGMREKAIGWKIKADSLA